jgi:hypothetical protein
MVRFLKSQARHHLLLQNEGSRDPVLAFKFTGRNTNRGTVYLIT